MEKSPTAFRTISEVSDTLDVPAHVLRFWEQKFPQIRPVKRGGGRRYYRPEDVALLVGIRELLYDDGLTIKGVQKVLRERGPRHVVQRGADGGDAAGLDFGSDERPGDRPEDAGAEAAATTGDEATTGEVRPADSEDDDAKGDGDRTGGGTGDDATPSPAPDATLDAARARHEAEAARAADMVRVHAAIGHLETLRDRLRAVGFAKRRDGADDHGAAPRGTEDRSTAKG